MWQDSGRYEWPLVGAPGEQTTAPDTRPYPEKAQQEIVDLRRQVEALKGENCDLFLGHAELTRRLNEVRAQVAQLEQAKRDGGTL